VLLFEIIFWLYLWIAVFKHIEKAGNNLLYFVLGELGTNPDDETGYFGHRGACLQMVFATPFNSTRWGEASPFQIKP